MEAGAGSGLVLDLGGVGWRRGSVGVLKLRLVLGVELVLEVGLVLKLGYKLKLRGGVEVYCPM